MNANRIINQVVELTAIRDIELVEYSLLRMLHQYIRPLDLRIYQVDASQTICGQMVFSNNQCHVYKSDIEVDKEITDMLVLMVANDMEEHTILFRSEYLSIFNLHKNLTFKLFLQVRNHERLSKQKYYVLAGLLKIFKNHVGLLTESMTDPLTGLFNRKSFDQAMSKINSCMINDNVFDKPAEIVERRQGNANSDLYWLVILDIDHFKKINDTYGHVYGDDVLILLAQLIRSSFRTEDLIFRFGGEEFVLIIKCEDTQNAHLALNRLLKRIENNKFSQLDKVTVSAGAVAIDHYTFSGTLFDYADQALYHSKENGRNQVTFYEDLITSGVINEKQICTGGIELF